MHPDREAEGVDGEWAGSVRLPPQPTNGYGSAVSSRAGSVRGTGKAKAENSFGACILSIAERLSLKENYYY